MKKLYVGNLPFTSSKEEIHDAFAAHGEVHSVKLIVDPATKKPRGFGFIEMDDKGAEAAIAALNESEFSGRQLRVNLARERSFRNIDKK